MCEPVSIILIDCLSDVRARWSRLDLSSLSAAESWGSGRRCVLRSEEVASVAGSWEQEVDCYGKLEIFTRTIFIFAKNLWQGDTCCNIYILCFLFPAVPNVRNGRYLSSPPPPPSIQAWNMTGDTFFSVSPVICFTASHYLLWICYALGRGLGVRHWTTYHWVMV